MANSYALTSRFRSKADIVDDVELLAMPNDCACDARRGSEYAYVSAAHGDASDYA